MVRLDSIDTLSRGIIAALITGFYAEVDPSIAQIHIVVGVLGIFLLGYLVYIALTQAAFLLIFKEIFISFEKGSRCGSPHTNPGRRREHRFKPPRA